MALPYTAREKLLFFGTDALSNTELLSLVIGTGMSEESAAEKAQNILYTLEENGNSLFVAEASELTGIIGEAKASAVVAAMELSRRLTSEQRTKTRMDSTGMAADILMKQLMGEKREHFVTLHLNTKLHLTGQSTISIGTQNTAPVDPKMVFAPAIKRGSAAIIVAHNHTSGDPTPSQQDYDVTDRLISAGEILGVTVLDHLIIGDGSYVSLRSEGYIS